MKKGELPDITKPFLALEHVPSITARNNESSTASGSDALKHAVHPDASVLALGILLCELHYCLPVELIAEAKDPTVRKGVNDDLYTCMAKLDELEDNAGADYYHATKSCLTCDYYTAGESSEFGDVSVQRRFYQNVVKRLETGISKLWGIRLNNLDSFDSRQNSLCWGKRGSELVELHRNQMGPPDVERSTRVSPHHSLSKTAPKSKPSLHSNGLSSPKPPSGWQNQACFNESSKTSSAFFDASHQTGSEEERLLSERWMDNLLSSIYRFVDLDVDHVEPVRIAILDSGLDPDSPFLFEDQQLPNPKIKEVRSFIHGTESHDIRDEIGHGTHALGLLLKVAPCAEIYVARVARQETLDSDTYDDIAKAINHAVEEWGADIISMSFGIREQHEGMSRAISNALNKQTLLFAAASNDGANLSRAFPAKWPGVFCIHSTDGNGNPSSFNPTASETDVNFSLLGESVSSHWPAGLNGHDQSVNVMSGTSVATPIAAALAASVLSFVRQQDQNVAVESDRLGPWLKIDSSMDAVLKQMAAKRGAGYDCITPDILFTKGSTREFVYARIEHIKKNIYRH
ncbi:hypothetical protein NW766_011916 [Fusarium irregulare]|uniref:Peptidase S8/S53 domain-containing protein n=1 Tax=Fusarium irregulare TaxID=2494466 RepID=A0A9W8U5A6_9HYPO|nr:hypothetical protein NW766_011916 [Fusarium irregulare]